MNINDEQARYAQDIVYEAMECICEDGEKAAKLCHKALSIDLDCVDAILMLSDLESETAEEHIASAQKAVAAGIRGLGEDFFEEAVGNFWGIIETRPFMRAMADLAESYLMLGKKGHSTAIQLYEEMLKLNPNDNQGIRYLLISCYFNTKRYADAGKLLDKYDDDVSALFLWSRVLYDYITSGKAEAEKSLEQAEYYNPHVLKYLIDRKRLPSDSPVSYTAGEESEAQCCAEILKPSWRLHPKAKKWLKEYEAGKS
ncbi:tetratricopeptide repeat protein [Sedimentisphaera salicampi]|uniref:tetratricopeptide repeat protein n=1 Tax=Sedimentisphaera salicampi TaxID=1941349 RepID=UPI000B9B743C|nr:tetratricopeptide repeat protein [Sedimentisphaera salicampi]OXU14726.1 putative PEP-CTERM system TPR-repeat lipoprotein [Sedimentisphaera salicampi]